MLISERAIKKIIYAGAIAGAFIAGIAFLIIRFFPFEENMIIRPTGPTYQEIEVGDAVVLVHPPLPGSASSSVDIVVRLRNPNPRAGINDYSLQFFLHNPQGEEIATARASTYLLPGALQYAVALGVSLPPGQRLGQVDIRKPDNIQFINVPERFELPTFSTFLQDRQVRDVAGNVMEQQTGIVQNTGLTDWERVEVVAVAVDSNNAIIGAGKTFVGRLMVGEQREFAVEWPRTSQPISNVIAIPSTNIFREDNFINIIGDPASLR